MNSKLAVVTCGMAFFFVLCPVVPRERVDRSFFIVFRVQQVVYCTLADDEYICGKYVR